MTATALTARLWDRLNPAERAALVRQWKAFSEAYLRLAQYPTQPSRLVDAWQDSLDVELLARKRQLYLRGLMQAWHWLSFTDKGLGDQNARIPSGLYENGADLDHVLWEQHPGNLLDELERGRA